MFFSLHLTLSLNHYFYCVLRSGERPRPTWKDPVKNLSSSGLIPVLLDRWGYPQITGYYQSFHIFKFTTPWTTLVYYPVLLIPTQYPTWHVEGRSWYCGILSQCSSTDTHSGQSVNIPFDMKNLPHIYMENNNPVPVSQLSLVSLKSTGQCLHCGPVNAFIADPYL